MKKILTVMLAAAVCAALIWTRDTQPDYKLETVTVRDLTEKIEAVGTVSYEQLYALSPRVAGTVTRIFVQEGDTVAKGQAVAEVELLPESAGNWICSMQNAQMDRVEMQEQLMEVCTVRAPADGVVVQMAGYEGMSTAPTATLGSLASEALCVTALVPESVKEEICVGQKATVRRGEHAYSARIVKIQPSAEAASQYAVTLRTDSVQETLCAGMKVDVTIIVEECSAPSVSLQAIGSDGTVKCRTETGVASVKVEVGLCSETYAQLLSGPPVGTQLVVGEEN